VAVTLAIVIVPFAGLGVAVWLAWGHGLRLADVLLATALYLVTGLGVTIGFHRLLTHRSFTAAPALLPPASRLTVNNVHVRVNSVARN
jgi:stearoyl-CoA desaturase (delta-9 desaturase)